MKLLAKTREDKEVQTEEWRQREEEQSQKIIMKSGQENQDQEVNGAHEGQIEVQRAEEMLEYIHGGPQQEGELGGAARAEIDKGQAGGTLR